MRFRGDCRQLLQPSRLTHQFILAMPHDERDVVMRIKVEVSANTMRPRDFK